MYVLYLKTIAVTTIRKNIIYVEKHFISESAARMDEVTYTIHNYLRQTIY